jgi:lysyl-tRNA synthetase class 1
MYWADELTTHIARDKHQRVDDMKTPSGRAHAGALRAIATHGLVYEALRANGFDVDFTYVVNDVDPMDGLPVYLDEAEYGQHMGKPLVNIPEPYPEQPFYNEAFRSKNFAGRFADEYIHAFEMLGFKPRVIWTSDLYRAGELDVWIRTVLDHVEDIRQIYLDVAHQQKPKGWYPLQVNCPVCGKVGTSLVTDWDGTEVTYECRPNLVKWAVGCGAKGKISPFGGNAKLMWKVEWPTLWAALDITVEGGGKDHFSAGGSRYIGMEIMPKVFGREAPFGFLHEFLLIGGAKMSSSKGLGTSAIDFVHFFPPEVARFLFVRTPYQRAISFDPNVSNTIPELYDEYDRCANQWFEHGAETDFGRFYEASQLTKPSRDKLYLPRFRTVATIMQFPGTNIVQYFENEKGAPFTPEEQRILDERMSYAEVWLQRYADDADKYELKAKLPDAAQQLSEEQRGFLAGVAELLHERAFTDATMLQERIYELSKTRGIPSKEAFAAMYTALIGKASGPKAGWLVLQAYQNDQQFVIDRLNLKR